MRIRKHATAAVLLAAATLVSGAASADQTVEELLKLGEETTILKAKAKRLEAQGQVAALQRQLDLANNVGTSVAPPPASALFAVQAIEGIGPTLYATILLENGATRDVKQGDVIGKNTRIVGIKPGEVIYQQGKARPVTVRVNPSITHSELLRTTERPLDGANSAVRYPGVPPSAVQPFQPAAPSGMTIVASPPGATGGPARK
jgi:type IV pilus biogenesis protein PilP